MTVTANNEKSPTSHLKNNKKTEYRCLLTEKYSFSLDDTDMVRLKVKIGNEITEDEIEIFNKECNLFQSAYASYAGDKPQSGEPKNAFRRPCKARIRQGNY
ncbi:MAG: hypothetical protein L6V93_18190 [Clostridiales bacterium]|nr:MAG: hypothetical protein L6V93_18190 [Clostridiales bacterium]